ncbi:DUF1566 domain-containing protein [Alcaligenaceae bacterium]|nr:DUF1566 domain-containing protein [Alcaligenaceae bacterium]
MDAIQFEMGGASIALPPDIVARNLIEHLQRSSKAVAAGRPRPIISEYLTGEGGVFAGDIRGDDGVTYGLIIAQPEDVGRAAWGPDGSHDLSQWDGLINTASLDSEGFPAARLARAYEADGHVDFYLPARRELLIAAANVPHLFGKDSWYWTSTPYGSRHAWAVDFENGRVRVGRRTSEFRVRPFRRLIY